MRWILMAGALLACDGNPDRSAIGPEPEQDDRSVHSQGAESSGNVVVGSEETQCLVRATVTRLDLASPLELRYASIDVPGLTPETFVSANVRFGSPDTIAPCYLFAATECTVEESNGGLPEFSFMTSPHDVMVGDGSLSVRCEHPEQSSVTFWYSYKQE